MALTVITGLQSDSADQVKQAHLLELRGPNHLVALIAPAAQASTRVARKGCCMFVLA